MSVKITCKQPYNNNIVICNNNLFDNFLAADYAGSYDLLQKKEWITNYQLPEQQIKNGSFELSHKQKQG